MCVRVCLCVNVYMHACVRACVYTCVCVCTRVLASPLLEKKPAYICRLDLIDLVYLSISIWSARIHIYFSDMKPIPAILCTRETAGTRISRIDIITMKFEEMYNKKSMFDHPMIYSVYCRLV